MKRSLVICALILIVAALLGWREKQELSREKEANAKLVKETAAIPSDDAQTPKAAAIPRNRLDRRNAELAMKEKVKTLTRDYFALLRNYDENPKGTPAEDFTKQLEMEAYMKSRLVELDPTAIKQFMDECNSNPELNLRMKRDINFYMADSRTEEMSEEQGN